MDGTVRQIVLERLPEGRLTADCFRLEQAPMPFAGDGEVLLKVLFITLDASNRAWMQGPTYRAALEPGQVMYGRALAEVIESHAPGFQRGDIVFAETGWRDWAVMPGKALQRRERVTPLTHNLSVYGISGLTAYHGLIDVGALKAGDTVVISAAGGAVGAIAGQVARLKGAGRVVGVAGGPEKCAWLTRELGYHAAVDYKAGDLRGALAEACPNGIDLYFDNTGGEILQAAIFAMNNHGRIACCGGVSTYDGPGADFGPRGVPGLIVTKRLTLEGFIVTDFADRREDALEELEGWVASGALKVPETVTEGLEGLPAALVGLLHGENRGKRIVKVA